MGWLALLEHFSMKAAKLRKRGMPKGMKCRYCQEIFRITFCGLLIACEWVCAKLFFQNILSVHVQIENCTRFRMALTPKTCYFFVCRVPRCQPLPLVSWKATPSLARTYLWNPCVGDSSRFSGEGGSVSGNRLPQDLLLAGSICSAFGAFAICWQLPICWFGLQTSVPKVSEAFMSLQSEHSDLCSHWCSYPPNGDYSFCVHGWASTHLLPAGPLI